MESDVKRGKGLDPVRQLQIWRRIYRMRARRNRSGALSFRRQLQRRNSGRVRRQPQPNPVPYNASSSATVHYFVAVFESGDAPFNVQDINGALFVPYPKQAPRNIPMSAP